MPHLDWIGKAAIVRHHAHVPYHLLHCDRQASFGESGAANLLIQGDNLLALKALLPYYGGRVKCAYIDPPYNTGAQGWIYNDAVDSPEIRAWLGRAVGPEMEDLTRHDKWLCMMYPRLRLIRELLQEDGVIFVSIDDVEAATLRLLLDEVFGRANHLGTIVWRNVTDNNPTRIATEHEYVLCFAKNAAKCPREWKSPNLAAKTLLLQVGAALEAEYPDLNDRQVAYTQWFRAHKAEIWPFDRYKFIDDGGIYTGSQSVHNPGKEGYRYDIVHPGTGLPCKQPLMGYRFPEDTMASLIQEGRILFGADESKLVELKVYASDYRTKLASVFELDGRVGTNELKAIFPENRRPFDFPKPTALIEELLSFTTKEEDIVLDCFAGSGTTGHAVMALNQLDGQRRSFILVEMDESIAGTVTAPRLKAVSQGYTDGKGQSVPGLGSGVRVCTIGEVLFDETGQVGSTVRFRDLAAHIFFAETGQPLPAMADGGTPKIGDHQGTAYYLLFNGILGDHEPRGGNVLTRETLAAIPEFDGLRVVFAEASTLGDATLKRAHVEFRQTPYGIRR